MIEKFKVFKENMILADIEVDLDTEYYNLKVYNLDKYPLHPFNKINQNFWGVNAFLQSRRIDLNRHNRHKCFKDQSIIGNTIGELKETRGASYDDYMWLKFEGDPITWEIIKGAR